MHEPVEITVLEEEKVFGFLPRELAHLGAQISWLLAFGFLVACAVSHVWWFAVGIPLAGVNALALDALAGHLRRLGYANSDLVGPEDDSAPGES